MMNAIEHSLQGDTDPRSAAEAVRKGIATYDSPSISDAEKEMREASSRSAEFWFFSLGVTAIVVAVLLLILLGVTASHGGRFEWSQQLHARRSVVLCVLFALVILLFVVIGFIVTEGTLF